MFPVLIISSFVSKNLYRLATNTLFFDGSVRNSILILLALGPSIIDLKLFNFANGLVVSLAILSKQHKGKL